MMEKWKSHGNSALAVMMWLVFSAGCNSDKETKIQEKILGVESQIEEEEGIQNERVEQETYESREILSLLSDYMALKNALYKDEFKAASAKASDMKIKLDEMESQGLPAQLKPFVRQVADAHDISTQRQHFATLSRQLYSIVKNKNVTHKTLYWNHCPKAMGGEGARWLSDEEQIQNPFMGQRMPACGSVAETIN